MSQNPHQSGKETSDEKSLPQEMSEAGDERRAKLSIPVNHFDHSS